VTRFCAVFLLAAGFALVQTGCGGPPGLQRVTGNVKFNDGTIPTGEIALVRFEPVAGTQAEGQSKGATGTINPSDGSYVLGTMEKTDGAYVGEYKVTFTLLKAYPNGPSLVDPKFTSIATTPHSAKVVKGGPNKFDFEILKAPGL